MTQVRINGEDAPVNAAPALRVLDLVELIKTHIDPDHMITEILLDGRDLAEKDWYAPVQTFGETAIFEVATGTPVNYVADRLQQAADIVRACYIDFRDSRKSFQSGDMATGNKKLIVAVNTLKAFFEWYGSLLELMTPESKKKFDITDQVNNISESCKKACQHQLYQSWWALGETLEKEIEPGLDKLEDVCRSADLKNIAV